LFGTALGLGLLCAARVFITLAGFGFRPFDLLEHFAFRAGFSLDFGALAVFILTNAGVGEGAGAGFSLFFRQ
jgi:hypothetical protein